MSQDKAKILVILKPHKVIPIFSGIIGIFWLFITLNGLSQCLFNPDLSLPAEFFFFILLFFSVLFWILLNGINTTITVRTDCIIM
ncbi:MAG: hypothetical protein ACOC0N_10295 [Chroococcales cyanobacterium]